MRGPHRKFPLVEVKWLDATDTPSWFDPEDPPTEPAPTVSVGYLLHSSKESVTLAALINSTHASLGITIPRKMIRAVKTLRESATL